MLLIVVDNGNQEACHSQRRVVELLMVVSRCIYNVRIGMGEGQRFLFCLRRGGGGSCVYQVRKRGGLGNYQKKDENIPALPPPQLKTYLPLKLLKNLQIF